MTQPVSEAISSVIPPKLVLDSDRGAGIQSFFLKPPYRDRVLRLLAPLG